MAATTTLGVTSLSYPVDKSSPQITVASTAGITAGISLYIDRELMSVVGPGPSGTNVINVRRGIGGTRATRHTAAAPMFVGSGDQFYFYDPQGPPPMAVLVYPHINVLTGDIWLPEGDTDPKASTNSWWQKVQVTYDQGALGYRSVTANPSS